MLDEYNVYNSYEKVIKTLKDFMFLEREVNFYLYLVNDLEFDKDHKTDLDIKDWIIDIYKNINIYKDVKVRLKPKQKFTAVIYAIKNLLDDYDDPSELFLYFKLVEPCHNSSERQNEYYNIYKFFDDNQIYQIHSEKFKF